jgi:hypothetical protein
VPRPFLINSRLRNFLVACYSEAVNSLHPIIDDSRINIARHEWTHCWLAIEQQFDVDAIVMEPHQGSTTITYPVTPPSFAEYFAQSPRQAAQWLVGIIAVIRSGNFVEVRGGQIGWDPDARDLEHIETWRTAMLPVYGADGWVRVYAESYRALKSWFSYPQVRAVFREVAPVIANQRRLSRHALHALYHESGAATCPAPSIETVMPSPRRQATPVQVPAISAYLRPRTELRPVPTASQRADIDDGEPSYSATVPLGLIPTFMSPAAK